MKRVGVDCDGVLADIDSMCRQLVLKHTGVDVNFSYRCGWDFDSMVPKDFVKEFRSLLRGPGAAYAMSAFEGAREGLARLQEVADVYVVTSPLPGSPTWAHDREAWLWDKFGISPSKIVSTHAKHTFSGVMLIDDKPLNIEMWLDENPTGVGLLWARPYNDGPVRNSSRVVRQCDWHTACFLSGQPDLSAWRHNTWNT